MISLRALCRDEVEKITSVDDGTFYSPIKLTGDNALTYEAVQGYLISKRATKLKIWDVAEAVLKIQPNVMEVNDNDVVNGKVSAYVMQFPHSLRSISLLHCISIGW